MKMNNVITYKSKRKGFTLAELLIVVAITVIIAGVSIPLFATFLNKYQLKQVKDLETAAKAAAVSAFYSGYDSKGNAVKIYETGACTFLYDAENSAVYVLNYRADINDFKSNGYSSLKNYGINLSDYSSKVILVTFEGRYYRDPKLVSDPNGYYKYPNISKGTFEEPILILEWCSTQ